MTAIQYSTDFSNWFTKIGGDLKDFDFKSTASKANFRPLLFSSLKIDPERTKRLYNHKFKHNEK